MKKENKLKFILVLFKFMIIIIYSFLFYLNNCLKFKHKGMSHHGPRVNRIDMILLSTKYNFFLGSSLGRNKKVKHVGARVVSG
jgi:hypothetical protein